MANMPEIIARINELARLAKERELTATETEERTSLRAQYLSEFRQSFKNQLDNTYVQEDDGSKVPIKEWHEAVRKDAEDAFDK